MPVEHQVHAHSWPEQQLAVGLLVGLYRLAVIGDNLGLGTGELQIKNAHAGHVKHTQPNALARSYLETGTWARSFSVQHNYISEAAHVGQFLDAPEIFHLLAVGPELEVAQHPQHFAVHFYRPGLFHNERPIQSARDLLKAFLMRVIPVGARIRNGKFIGELAPGGNRHLCHLRHAIHGVRHAQPMPMHRSLVGQSVPDNDPHPVSLAVAQHRTRDRLVKSPYLGFGIACGNDFLAEYSGTKQECRRRFGQCRGWAQRHHRELRQCFSGKCGERSS